MKELLLSLASYSVWANQKLANSILLLTEEKQREEIPSSFKSLLATVLHTWDAESIWWQRLKLNERVIIPSENFNGTMAEAVNGLLHQSLQWQEWVNSASEPALNHVVQYHNFKSEHYKQPVYQMLIHVFNHSTYHRGQLVNMLRQLGIQKIPQTDFIVYSRSKK